MPSIVPSLGILQGRLTPSPDGSIQFFPQKKWEEEFFLARQIGFNCLEWLVKRDSLDNFGNNPILNSNKIQHINTIVRWSGVRISSVHAFFSDAPDFPALLRRLIGNMRTIGAETLLISFFNEQAIKTEQAKAFARQQLSTSVQLADSYNIVVGIETELFDLELLRFVRSFGCRNVGVYYDLGNMASVGADLSAEIQLLGNRICGVHIKDRLANGGKTVPLGSGCVDFERAFQALAEINYRGPFIIQGARVQGVNDVRLNGQYFRFCQDLLQKTYGGENHG